MTDEKPDDLREELAHLKQSVARAHKKVNVIGCYLMLLIVLVAVLAACGAPVPALGVGAAAIIIVAFFHYMVADVSGSSGKTGESTDEDEPNENP